MSSVVKHSRIRSFSCASLLCESLEESAASRNWRKEPLVTPSLYGAVLRKGLKSWFGAPTLLPQRDSCNLLSHTPILQLLQSLPMADQTRCWIRGSRKQKAARSGENRHTPESATKAPRDRKLLISASWTDKMGFWTALILASQLLLHVDGQALSECRFMMCGDVFFCFLYCFPQYQLCKPFLRVLMISDNQRRRQLYPL